jgi:hypothetical protein
VLVLFPSHRFVTRHRARNLAPSDTSTPASILRDNLFQGAVPSDRREIGGVSCE